MPKLTDSDSQWRKLPHAFSDSEKINMKKITTDLMWRKIREMRNFTDERVFPNLAKLAKRVLSLPPSNADSKRIFPGISFVKTKKQNRLKKESIEAVLVTKSQRRTKDTVCYKYAPTDNQIKLHNPKNLYVATPPPCQKFESESEDEEDH